MINITRLFDRVNLNYENIAIEGLSSELNILFIYNTYLKKKKNLLIVENSLYEATTVYERLLNYTDRVLFFPMDNFITSEALAMSPELKMERLHTLKELSSYDIPYIVVTNLMGALRYLPSCDIYQKNIIHLKVNQNVKPDDILSSLINIGYENSNIVEKIGQFSYRGYILDIYPFDFDHPVRIEFWGDTIDNIRFFDINSQLSNEKIDDLKIYPYSEFLLEEYPDDVIVSQKYLSYYQKKVFSIGDYLGEFSCFFYDYNSLQINYEHLLEEIEDYYTENKPIYPTEYVHKLTQIVGKFNFYILNTDNILPHVKISHHYHFESSEMLDYQGNMEKLCQDILLHLEKGNTICLFLSEKRFINELNKILDRDLVFTSMDQIFENKINLIKEPIQHGFCYENLYVVSENDILKSNIKRSKYHQKFEQGSTIKDVSSIQKGDYIVHDLFGIGIYDSICTIDKKGIKKDYIKLIYADSDVLYIPVEKIDRITKYASREGYVPKLNKLGTDEWHRKKSRLKDKIKDMAEKILKVSAEREAQEGYAFSLDDESQAEFERQFKFQETVDQLTSTEKIKKEMEKPSPMDMLLCGDVGYGKTEVAFRAIFKAMNDGKQVAYLCPTTILSNQQYQSALERFQNFPFHIALLNRFVSKKDQEIILKKLLEGKIDLVFGTHRLLSKDVKFKDLGLLVVDEEQRFGVTHKEKIKEYKSNVDVLTLSATPIPRTLQMSMAGLRGLALIDTPPAFRYPVQTYVLPFNKALVKDAIYKELARKGQVFLLYNKVSDIEDKVDEIRRLVPEARIDFAHGQMSKIVLENKMKAFVDYEMDVLVCTTIIETGIDIPNANTLIICDADCFGLSQLYQIRGRIGRSNKIGYAYLMYDNKKVLNDIAIKRLQTIKEFTQLGSGFKIAMRDLSIRGAGDILGSEQSGFIDSIGIELYLKLLNEAVLKLKNKEQNKKEESEEQTKETPPLVDVSTHLNDKYVLSDALKIEIHKKINEVDSYEKLLEIRKEIEDRFGKISKDMELYMYEEWFEKLAEAFEIKEVRQTKTYVEFSFSEEISKKIDGDKIFYLAYDISKYFRFAYKNNKITVILDTVKLEGHFLIYFIRLLDQLKGNLCL